MILTTIFFSYRSQNSGELFSNIIILKKVTLFQGIRQSEPRDPRSSKVYKVIRIQLQQSKERFYHLVNLYILLFCKRRQHFPKINIEAAVWLRFKGWILTKILRFMFFNILKINFYQLIKIFEITNKCITYETRKGSRGGPCKS